MKQLPSTAIEFMTWTWLQIEPHFQELAARPIDAGSVQTWLADWSRLSDLIGEVYQRLYVAITINTEDSESKRQYDEFLDEIYPKAQAADQVLKEKLIASRLDVTGFEMPLRSLRLESEIFREANLPLLTQELKLSAEYDKISGAQTIQWDGNELTILQAQPLLQEPDRSIRERVWRLGMERTLADRTVFNAQWAQLIDLRADLARNAGMENYLDYRWKQLLRFDYTPDDCLRFHDAIEAAVVPAARQLYAKQRERLGLEVLRPWDLLVDPFNRPALRPFQQSDQLEAGVAQIFQQVDPQLGAYFETMRRERLLDLENRKGKAPGGYCTEFNTARRPFIFMNAVGIHEDVLTLLHEGGHGFHVFETAHLPYIKQRESAMEFAEVASMSMELLGGAYLAMPGGFYQPVEAARARITHLSEAIWFWPYMAVVDAFQHWAYKNPNLARESSNCDGYWKELWERFMPGVDWSGLEDELVTGWHRKPHIFQTPFYYIEYGLALLGAFQVWRNSLDDRPGAVASYRRALALGGTASLPDLFAAAGARLSFEAEALRQAVDLAMETIDELEQIHA